MVPTTPSCRTTVTSVLPVLGDVDSNPTLILLPYNSQTMSEFTPYESTLTMQSYVQMRDHTSLDFLDVFTPSTNLERELGWDMQIRNLKGVVFQYKRPKLSKDGSRRFSVRYSNQDDPRQLDQMKNWDEKFDKDLSYYALPLVSEHDTLNEALIRTAFVHAVAIPENASVIHVPEDYCYGGNRQSRKPLEVYCSTPSNTDNNWTETINATDVYGWDGLYEEIIRCNVGFKIRYRGDSWEERYHEDHSYYPIRDNMHWTEYTRKELFGLGKERGPYITRFGSDNDSAFA